MSSADPSPPSPGWTPTSSREPGPASPASSNGSRTAAGDWATGGALLLACAFGVWLSLYTTGAFPWLGYTWLSEKSVGVGPVAVIGNSRAGTTLGLSEFLLFAGQEVVVEYDAEIRAGSLWFHVFQPWDGELGDGESHYVSESGQGTWTRTVPRTGWYHVTIGPTVVGGRGRGWDLSYTATWGARPAAAGDGGDGAQ